MNSVARSEHSALSKPRIGNLTVVADCPGGNNVFHTRGRDIYDSSLQYERGCAGQDDHSW